MAKEKEEQKGVKLDFDIILKRVSGKSMYEQDEITGEPDTDKPFMIRGYLANLLWNAKEKEEADVNNAMLAMKIFRAKTPIILKAEEHVTIKKLVKKASTPGVTFQIEQWLEGKDPFKEDDTDTQ